MTPDLNTARISNDEILMSRIRKMMNIRLGNEIEE